jgi:hypothetical protein
VRELSVVSVRLCKGNGVLYRASLKILARSSGNAFLPSVDVPTADIILFYVSYLLMCSCMSGGVLPFLRICDPSLVSVMPLRSTFYENFSQQQATIAVDT